MAAYRNVASAATERLFAENLMKNYRPLVEVMILTEDGKLVDRRNVNDDIISIFGEGALTPDESVVNSFSDFLQKSASFNS